MEYPLISVIIPAYNAEKWISECCQSVFDQTYPHWELIVIDDGSTDETRLVVSNIVRGRENARLIHIENGGVCRARNMGMQAAGGELITFLDADDLLLPDALELLYEGLSRENADIVIGWKTNMTAQKKEIGCPYQRESAVWVETEALEASLKDHPATYSVWGKLFRRQILSDIRFVEGKKVHEDSFFLFECLLKKPKVVLLKDVVLRYRISENSASRSGFSEKYFDILFFAEAKEKKIRDLFPQYLSAAEDIKVRAYLNLLYNLCKTYDRRYRPNQQACIKYIRENSGSFVPKTALEKRCVYLIRLHLFWIYKAYLFFKLH